MSMIGLPLIVVLFMTFNRHDFKDVYTNTNKHKYERVYGPLLEHEQYEFDKLEQHKSEKLKEKQDTCNFKSLYNLFFSKKISKAEASVQTDPVDFQIDPWIEVQPDQEKENTN